MNIPFIKSTGDRPAFGKRSDCAVIALSNATGISYFESEKFLADNGRKHNHGTYTQRIFGHELNKTRNYLGFNFHLVFKAPWETNKITYKTKKKGISLNQFLLQRLPGTYMCNTRNHIFTVRDGIVLSAQPEPGRCILEEIWKVEKLNGNSTPAQMKPIINIEKFSQPVALEQNKLEKHSWLKNYLE